MAKKNRGGKVKLYTEKDDFQAKHKYNIFFDWQVYQRSDDLNY